MKERTRRASPINMLWWGRCDEGSPAGDVSGGGGARITPPGEHEGGRKRDDPEGRGSRRPSASRGRAFASRCRSGGNMPPLPI